MDSALFRQAENWQKRAGRCLSENGESDPYSAYFSYFICLLIIAKDHANHSSRKCANSDCPLIRSLFRANYQKVLDALQTPELRSVTSDLANRLNKLDSAIGQSIVYVKPNTTIEDNVRLTIADLNDLSKFWKGQTSANDCIGGLPTRSVQVFTFLWQVRNNLFHGEKGYGSPERVAADEELLSNACKILEALTGVLL